MDIALRILALRGDFDAEVEDPNQLPEPLATWRFFYTPNVEVAYSLDAVQKDHTMTGSAANPVQPRAGSTEKPFEFEVTPGSTIILGQLSTSLAFLNGPLQPGPP